MSGDLVKRLPIKQNIVNKKTRTNCLQFSSSNSAKYDLFIRFTLLLVCLAILERCALKS